MSIEINLPKIRFGTKGRVSVYSGWDIDTCYILDEELANVKTVVDLRNKWKEVEEYTDDDITKLQKYMKDNYDKDDDQDDEMDNFYFLLGLTDDVPSEIQQELDQWIEESREQQNQEDLYNNTLALAKQTNEKQLLRTYMTDGCRNGNDEDCSFDRCHEYVLPNGKIKREYTCCY